jgi:GDP-L-fucose synthase
MLHKENRIFVAGHRGLVGSALTRRLIELGHTNVITRTRAELDLLDQAAVHEFFQREKIEYVFMAAARVGGIYANSTHLADFLYENLVISANTIHAAFMANTEKFLYLGSSCVYPRLAPQPIREESLMTGPLEPTNEGYAIAKIAGLKLCEMFSRQYGRRFISAMPTNVYGPRDNFDPLSSHVVPAMLRRFHEAKEKAVPSVSIWGTGTPQREFLHVEDLVEALLLLMERYEEPETINVGSGDEVTIRELAEVTRDVVGYEGAIEFDPSRPDGTPRKALDSSRIHALGWHARHSLREGLRTTYEWVLSNGMFRA